MVRVTKKSVHAISSGLAKTDPRKVWYGTSAGSLLDYTSTSKTNLISVGSKYKCSLKLPNVLHTLIVFRDVLSRVQVLGQVLLLIDIG